MQYLTAHTMIAYNFFMKEFMNKIYAIRWNPAVALVALFFLYILAGVLLSLLYGFWMERVGNPAGRFVAPFIFGALLGCVVFGLKRFFTVRLNAPAGVVVLMGCAAVYFLMWGEFPMRGPTEVFAFWERELPEAMRDFIYNWDLPVRTMQVLGVGEVLAIFVPPLVMALRRAGIFLRRYNRWAKLKVLDYGFIPFHDHELDRLVGGDVNTLLRKPIDLTGHRRIHCAALCYAGDKLTEYFTLFKASWNRQGYIEKGPLLLLTVFPMEKIAQLQDDLYEIHRESEFEA